MKYSFSNEEIQQGSNRAELEDLEFTCDYVEGEGRCFNAFGQAKVDGEIYNGFQLEIRLNQDIAPETAGDVFNADWEEYDYIFPV